MSVIEDGMGGDGHRCGGALMGWDGDEGGGCGCGEKKVGAMMSRRSASASASEKVPTADDPGARLSRTSVVDGKGKYF